MCRTLSPRGNGQDDTSHRTTNFGMADPNLRTPYVQQYTIGIQQNVKGAVVEVRYLGNHGTKQWRAFDYNQVVINSRSSCSSSSCGVIGAPLITNRSHTETRCGLVNRPTL